MRELTLIFPNQLFDDHPALQSERPVLLYEEPLLYGNDSRWPLKIHKKRLLLYRAALRAYRETLEIAGYEVDLLTHTGERQYAACELLSAYFADSPPAALYIVDLEDDLLERRMKAWAEQREVALHFSPSPKFLTPRGWGLETIARTKKPLMASFYQRQRRRLQILVDEDGKPTGGQWSFDAENRKKLPKGQPVPEPYHADQPPWLGEVTRSIEEDFPEAIGSVSQFEYPVTTESARAGLERFLHERFSLFGDYEDALSLQHRHLFHSVLTPALNTGLLTPQEVVDAALHHAQSHDIPLNSLEGFIRQITGWREFMRLIYCQYGREQRTRNFWGHDRPIPKSFYEGTTGILPIDHLITQLHETAYCHHIERLMVLGNFLLLCRFDPDAVYRWFMEFFIDADDWVMVPNVYGMTQFADGGVFSTKPYIAGSNYLRKMSNYPKGDGQWQKTWDALFWAFVIDEEPFFRAQPRLGMMTRQLDKRGEGWKSEIRGTADAFFETF